MSNKPLEGINVVELSTYVAAPGCARMLSDLGAEVIKIESLAGDQWRETGKKMTKTGDDENPVFDVYNSGKKSVCVNIKNKKGLDFLFKMIEQADVFVTNTRMRSLKKLGLDADTLTARFPRLVYASIDGFGSCGPDANSPGFDNIAFWARSGFSMDMPYRTNNSFPLPPTSGIGDCVSGGFLLAGIMTALYKREKTQKGDIVNVSLYGAAIWAMSSMLLRANPKYGEEFPVSSTHGDPLTNNYECADGRWVNISVRAYDKDAPLMYEMLGITEQISALGEVNVNNYCVLCDDIIPIIRQAMLKKTSDQWIREFRERDLVIGRLAHMTEVFEDEQAWENGFIENYVNRNGETSVISCPPIKLRSFEKGQSPHAPEMGEHTKQLLQEHGYSDAEIQQMIIEGAVK